MKLCFNANIPPQPGVDDVGMIQLVNEKVDAFWKGIEGRANKRGQVCICFYE